MATQASPESSDESAPAPHIHLSVSSRTISRLLLGSTALVSVLGLGVELLKARLKLKDTRGALPLFSLSYEQNLPTFYTCALLLFCALLLALIASSERKKASAYVHHWRFLALGFLYIAFDELVSIHEGLGFFKLSGLLYFSWVIPAAIVVAFVGLAYLRFLLQLPKRSRIIFLAAGALYVLGAVGMELPLGYWTSHHGSDNLGYALIDWTEETLEMLGLTLFAPALIEYLAHLRPHLSFSAPPSP